MTMYLQYQDPIRITWRKGTIDDPYVNKTESQKIINHVIVLAEIPDTITHVSITGYVEIYKGSPTSNQFIVNYQNGTITFNASEEGKSVDSAYKGRGIIQYPASRIYAHNSITNVEQNLQNIIDNHQTAIDTEAKLGQMKTDVDTAIANSNTATANANTATTNANTAATNANNASTYATTQGDYAKAQGDYAKIQGDNALAQANNAQTQAGYAKTQGDYALAQGDYAKTQGNYALAQGDYAKNKGDNLKHMGDYDPLVAYQPLNIVKYQSATYQNKVASTGIAPTDVTHWHVLVAVNGVDSVNGKTGAVVLDASDVNAIKNLGRIPSIQGGVYSSLPVFGTIDRLYLSIDTKKLYRDNGTSWEQLFDDVEWNKVLNKVNASGVTDGLMLSADFTKLQGISTSAKNVASSTVNGNIKIDGFETVVYTHPTSHPATMITEDGTHRFITDIERTSWNGMLPKDGSIAMTGLLTLFNNPTQPLHAVTKQYADALKENRDTKDSVRVATTANIVLSAGQTIDGVVLVVGDRVLAKNQTNASENGIYVVATGAWTRSIDADTSAKVTTGMYVFVEEGSVNGNNGFTLITTGAITLGTTALNFTQSSGAGQVVNGTGLGKNANTIYILDTGVIAGTYKSVEVNAQGQVISGTNPTTLSGYGIVDATPSSHIGSGGNAHALANGTTAGFLSSSDFTKLAGISTGANKVELSITNGNILVDGSQLVVYTHPIGDGNLHIPTTGTSNNLKVLTSGATAGSLSWAFVDLTNITGVLNDTQHGDRSGGTLHALATSTIHGFMSASDFAKLTGIEVGATATAYPVISETVPTTSSLKEGQVWYKPSSDSSQMFISGALRDVGGVPPQVSSTKPTTNLKEGLVWYNPTNGDIKQYLNGDFRNAGGGASALIPHEATITLATAQSSFNHGILDFNPDLDILFLYKGGVFLKRGTDYTLSLDGKTITKIQATDGIATWASGSAFEVFIIASIPSNNSLVTKEIEKIFNTTVNGTTNIPIGIIEYNSDSDVLEVYVDGSRLVNGQNYQLNANKTSIDLLGWSANVTPTVNQFLFVAKKQTRVTTNAIDGALIVDGSIAYSKFSVDAVQKDLDNEILAWMGV